MKGKLIALLSVVMLTAGIMTVVHAAEDMAAAPAAEVGEAMVSEDAGAMMNSEMMNSEMMNEEMMNAEMPAAGEDSSQGQM